MKAKKNGFIRLVYPGAWVVLELFLLVAGEVRGRQNRSALGTVAVDEDQGSGANAAHDILWFLAIRTIPVFTDHFCTLRGGSC